MTTKRKAYIAHSLTELRRLYASGIDATLAPASDKFLQATCSNDKPIKQDDEKKHDRENCQESTQPA